METETVKKKKRGRPPKVKYPEGYEAADFKCDCEDACLTKDNTVREEQARLAKVLESLTKRTGHPFPIVLGYRCKAQVGRKGKDTELPYEKGQALMAGNPNGVHPEILLRTMDQLRLEEGFPMFRVFMKTYSFWIAYT